MSPGRWRCPWPSARACPGEQGSSSVGGMEEKVRTPPRRAAQSCPSVPSPPPSLPLCLRSAFLQL